MLYRSYSHAKIIWTWHGSMLTSYLLGFRGSSLISVYSKLAVVQPLAYLGLGGIKGDGFSKQPHKKK